MDAKAGDPMYRYGKQQMASRYDPSALEEDLGDDPMKAGDYGIKNLKYILSNLNKWILDDETAEHRQGFYNPNRESIQPLPAKCGVLCRGYLFDGSQGRDSGKRFVAVPRQNRRRP